MTTTIRYVQFFECAGRGSKTQLRGGILRCGRAVPLPVKGVPNFLLGVLLYRPLIGGPPVFSEGVLAAGVVGVRNPLTGFGLPVAPDTGVLAELVVLMERFSFVGDITLFDGCCGNDPMR